ncbi:MAG: HNH endonuclease [Actinomycetota bacterium]|nr:HNH endonuclease [Actinomycetota bacterium]
MVIVHRSVRSSSSSTGRTLFAHGAGSGHLPGFGPLPADLARDLAATGTTRRDHTDTTDTSATRPTATREADRGDRADGAVGGPTPRQRAWVRRLFLDPADGSVWLRDTRRRRFDGPLRNLLIARDQRCRTPWCDAPIRHLDHITPHRDGGPTTAANGEGLCGARNHTNEVPGWATERIKTPGAPDQVKITTPTGRTYYS